MHIFLTTLMMVGTMPGAPVPAPPRIVELQGDTCTLVRISPRGRRTVIDEDHADYDRLRRGSARAGAGNDRAYASSSSSGSSRSSVSVSSSSRGGRSSASATTRDRDGVRTVTTTHDDNGCTTVIDERPAPRSDR